MISGFLVSLRFDSEVDIDTVSFLILKEKFKIETGRNNHSPLSTGDCLLTIAYFLPFDLFAKLISEVDGSGIEGECKC